jgi:hypothetical protein
VVGPPPKKADVPAGLWPIFTMDGRAKEESYFVDDTQGGAGSHYRYPRENIDAMVTHARKLRSILARAVEAGRADRPLRALGKNVRRRDVYEYVYEERGKRVYEYGGRGGAREHWGRPPAWVWCGLRTRATSRTTQSGLPLSLLAVVSLALCRLYAHAHTCFRRRPPFPTPPFNPSPPFPPYVKEWIFRGLYAHPLEGLTVAVLGSMEPWWEAVCLAHGASRVTTIEYNRLTYDHPDVRTLTPGEWYAGGSGGGDAGKSGGGESNLVNNPVPVNDLSSVGTALAGRGSRGNGARDKDSDSPDHRPPQSPPPQRFDVALSISSFDHDGLGRYGDPLAPDGDLHAMHVARTLLLTPTTGKLLLTVPIGPDVIAWNLHRRYGKHRLPKLLRGWKVLGQYGWDAAKRDAPAYFARSYEPAWVLIPEEGGEGGEEAGGEATAPSQKQEL